MPREIQKRNFSHPDDLQELEPYSGFLAVCKSPHTKLNYEQDLRVLKAFLESTRLNPFSAKPQDMARFAGHLAKPGVTPAGRDRAAYSTRSMKRILASTRSFYRYLASIQQITTDPTAVFHTLALRSPQRNPRPLSPQDREALVRGLQTKNLGDQKVSLVVLLGFHCGLRVSEIAHLKGQEIDPVQGMVTVIGKGDKERSVPITQPIIDLLKTYLGNPERTPEESQSLFLFPSPRDPNKPIHPAYLETWVKKAAHWAGFKAPDEISVHVLRHSFGTQLAEAGASVYEIRDLMGHSSILVSESYVKLASTQARDTHRKAFGQGPGSSMRINIETKDGVPGVLSAFRSGKFNHG